MSDQSTKEKSYCHVCEFAFAVLVSVPIVTTLSTLLILVQYGTVIDHVVTVPEFTSLD
jgi:hypothetical protein